MSNFSGNTVTLTPALITNIQNDFVTKLGSGLDVVGHYALALFFVVAGIELALFGLAWAIRQESGFGIFALKVLKLGIILAVITVFPHLLQVIINGFTQTAFQVTALNTSQYIFNPAEIWKFGFDSGIKLLQLSVTYGTTNTGMSSLYLMMGMGCLILFALIGIQIVLAVVGFYAVALVALLLLPLGAYTGSRSFLDKALSGVIKSGVRVFVVILVVGVGVTVWTQFSLTISDTTTIDKPLSLCFSALIFLVLAWKLPGYAVMAVGELGGDIFGGFPNTPNVSVNVESSGSSSSSFAGSSQSPVAAGSNMAAAASVATTASASPIAVGSSVQGSGGNLTASVNVSSSGTTSGLLGDVGKKNNTADSAKLSRGISRNTLSKLKGKF